MRTILHFLLQHGFIHFWLRLLFLSATASVVGYWLYRSGSCVWRGIASTERIKRKETAPVSINANPSPAPAPAPAPAAVIPTPTESTGKPKRAIPEITGIVMKNLTSKTGKLIIAVVVSFGFGFGSGWPTGWMYRDHQLVSTYNSYRDVSVERRYDATHYLLRPAGMGVYKFDFDAPQDFDEGQKMAGLEYEQRLGVKHVIRAYFCPTHCDSNGRRINYREEVTNARN